MTAALTIPGTIGILQPQRRAAEKSAVHKIALALVWITVALSSVVFTEPAPVDAMTIGLILLLPVIGLTRAEPALAGGFALWLVIAAAGAISAVWARDVAGAALHMAVSFYLYGACFIFALFVAKNPLSHTQLILNANLVASTIAAVAGIIGYLDLVPGAFDLFTKFGRAAGPFKDPNVFGPFLIAGLLTALHLWLMRPVRRGWLPLFAAALITIAILFSFSRGAWAAALVALGIYSYLYMLTAPRNLDRLKLAGLVIFGAAALGLVLAAALQSDAVAQLLAERSALTQPYDEGANGRFGGQEKAFQIILENPLGLGARDFSRFHHHEEVHNVYLSMMLNTGWLGGLLYIALCAGTLALGFQHALKRTKTRPLFLIVYAALAGNMLEGMLIDSDHWRHFYLLLGIVWGLMAADRREVRAPRIVRDRRPILMLPVLVIPPTSRAARITGRVARPGLLTGVPLPSAQTRRRPRRPARLLAYHR
jgi:O-antigen ligase